MKKTIALLLVLVMTLGVFAACSKNNQTDGTTAPSGTENTTPDSTQQTPGDTQQNSGSDAQTQDTALEVLNKIWGQFGEEDRFPVVGGDSANMTDGAPGSFDVTNTEELRSVLLVNESIAPQVTEAASLVHMMNANVFTGGTLKISGDLTTFAATVADTIANNQWLCGQPGGYFIAQVAQDMLMVAYGDTAALDLMRTNLKAAYPNAAMLHDDVIA